MVAADGEADAGAEAREEQEAGVELPVRVGVSGEWRDFEWENRTMSVDWREAGVCILIALAACLAGPSALQAQNYVRESEPKLFSYDELVQLGSDQKLSTEMADKFRVITTKPFINNEAWLEGARPRPLEVVGLGPSLRVAFWNIERG